MSATTSPESEVPTPRSGAPLLEIRDLCVTYATGEGDGLPAVRGVDLVVERGQIVGVAGESGCGKSTLASTILRLQPTSAEVTGEVLFVRDSAEAFHEVAQRSGARVVHSCGFDSIPSDIGVWETTRVAREEGAGELTDTVASTASALARSTGAAVSTPRTRSAGWPATVNRTGAALPAAAPAVQTKDWSVTRAVSASMPAGRGRGSARSMVTVFPFEDVLVATRSDGAHPV